MTDERDVPDPVGALPETERRMWCLAREDGVAMRVVPDGRVVGTPAALDRIEAMAVEEFKRVLKTRSRRLPDAELRALIERLTADVEELPDGE